MTLFSERSNINTFRYNSNEYRVIRIFYFLFLGMRECMPQYPLILVICLMLTINLQI